MSTNPNLVHVEEQILPKLPCICTVSSLQYLDLLFWWLEKITHIPQIMGEIHGDESHGRICKKAPTKQTQ